MYAACFVDNNSQNAKRLANRKFPPAIFGAALAVMDINSGKMLKHRQLILLVRTTSPAKYQDVAQAATCAL